VAICPNVGWLKDFANPQTFLDPTFNGANILAQNNSNWSELDVPEINDAMEQAKLLTDPAESAQAWADIDTQITEAAPAVMWIWDKNPVISSKNVQAVIDEDNALHALPFTSLK
jgi:peptide/nickel transport system substrate-binding protein